MLGLAFLKMQTAMRVERGGEVLSFHNKSIYLPMLGGRVVAALDGSFYKAFCGEGR